MNTNFYAFFTAFVLTNYFTNMASLDTIYVRAVVEQHLSSTVMIGTNRLVVATNYPIATNYFKLMSEWKQVPLRIQHNPLGIPDQPPLPNYFR